jgi:hypothetical protein
MEKLFGRVIMKVNPLIWPSDDHHDHLRGSIKKVFVTDWWFEMRLVSLYPVLEAERVLLCHCDSANLVVGMSRASAGVRSAGDLTPHFAAHVRLPVRGLS